MIRFEFTKEELEDISKRAYLNDMQRKIIEYRMLDYSLTKMALLEHCSERTISRELNKIKKKIKRVL